MGGIFHEKILTVIVMKLLERLNDQVIDRKPDRSPPVGVPAEQAAIGFRGLVGNSICDAVYIQLIRMLRINAREGSDAMGGEKFIFVQHTIQDTLHTMPAQNCEQASVTHSRFVPA